ncbi:phospholipase D-like domain-containing protein [Bacillus cereus]|uniref:phospholipase D-like domain-containing protein n=1 Tax=Bacillus cereus TaxID=1396 RepID=UPI0015D4A06B|nr:phospholipase D-like domain-containing protein [Bacillus cereus]
MEVFFSTPGNSDVISSKIKQDIEKAKNQVFCAICYWDDESICDEVISSKALSKKIVLNNGLPSTGVLNKLTKNKIDMVFLGVSSKPYSNMHHKFIIIDDILWMGSYNFTAAARDRNYESMIRVSYDKEESSIHRILDTYKKEFNRLWTLGEYLKNEVQIGKGTCIYCGENVINPFEHYLINIIYNEGELADVSFSCLKGIVSYPTGKVISKCSLCGCNNGVINGNIKYVEKLNNGFATTLDIKSHSATVCPSCFLDGNHQ